jgi:transcription antitermination factor NusG
LEGSIWTANRDAASASPPGGLAGIRRWYAVFTVPRHEQSVAKRLEVKEIDSFVPTYEAVRVWKNRQRMKIVLPLFPSYLFVYADQRERVKVLQSSGVLQIVGNGREPVPVRDSEVEFLRSQVRDRRIEPYRELAVGERMRIKAGVMQGIEGVLVRKNNRLRFVLAFESINQHASIEVHPEDLEPVGR